MQNYIKQTTLPTLLMVTLLNGCGGGGSGATTDENTLTSPTSTTTKSVSETPSVQASSSLHILDANYIEGVRIKCASETLYTAKDGSFSCKSRPFSIYLGEYKLADINDINYDNLILTQDIMQQPRGAIVYPEVTKLSMILQTLDKDAILSNGIQLDKNVVQIANNYLNNRPLKDITFEELEQNLQDIVNEVSANDTTLHLKVISKTTAQTNLASTTANLPAPSPIQRSIGRL